MFYTKNMMKIVIFLVFLFAISHVAEGGIISDIDGQAGTGRCPTATEIFLFCGPARQATCANQATDNDRRKCVKGCFCPPGQVRDLMNACILPVNCPAR